MSPLDKLYRFSGRHQGAVSRKIVHELLAKVWIRPSVRRWIRPLFLPRSPKQWLFVAGCYNSGTTILREILGAHPEIATLPREGVRFTDAFPSMEIGGWQRMWHRNAALADMTKYDPSQIADRAIRDWSPWWRNGADVFLEKSITHGAWMPFLQEAFPGARFIFVIRNGFCATEGILRRAQPGNPAAEILGRNSYPPMEAARQWVTSNQSYLRDKDSLHHLFEFRYEDFASNPGQVISQVLDFAGVSKDSFADLGGGNIRIKERTFPVRDQNPSSFARLSQKDYAEIAAEIGPMMTTLGYETAGFTQ